MFRLIEAKRYRCLKDVSQRLNPFEILVGANASGKSTFLDVIAFLGDFMSDSLEASVERRTTNFHDLVWGRQLSAFEFSSEAQVPLGASGPFGVVDRIEYKVVFRLDPEDEGLEVAEERVWIASSPVVTRLGTSLRLTCESLGEPCLCQ